MYRLKCTSLGLLIALVTTRPAAAELEIYPVSPGIYRGNAPQSAHDFDLLKKYGIKTVLDTRKFNDSAVAHSRHMLVVRGIIHKHVPMGFFPRRDRSVEQALHVIANPRLQPVYLHCKLGQDRVGLVIGAYRVRYEGWSKAAAYREMEQYGYHRVLIGLTRYYRLEVPGSMPPRG